MLASAKESVAAPADIPAWRLVLGNVAAGALAGCAVEAGANKLNQIDSTNPQKYGL